MLVLSAQAPGADAAPEANSQARLLSDPRVTLPVVTVVLVAIPLIYYLALVRLDVNWKMASQASNHGRRSPLHAVEGIAIPLALLAFKGARRSVLRRIPHGQIVAWAAVLVGTVPAISYTIAQAHIYTNPTPGNANFVTQDESHALSYLAHDPTPGGVLTQLYLGESPPGLTGRQVNVGNCLWSEPRCYQRSDTADALFGGQLSPVAARVFVHDSGARFLLASCSPHTDLRRPLGSLVVSFKRFGCADVYELAPPSRARGPLVALASTRTAPS